MTRIHLIRHGETEWNLQGRLQGHKESHLTTAGIRQAEELKEKLKVISFDAAYCSSSIRAARTADIILQDREITSVTSILLKEINMGKFEGMKKSDLKEQYPEQYRLFWEDPASFKPLGGEDYRQLQERAVLAFTDIVNRHKNKEILLVSHGAFIKVLLAHFEKRPLSQLWQPPVMGNCSHSIIEERGEGEFKVVQYSGLKEW